MAQANSSQLLLARRAQPTKANMRPAISSLAVSKMAMFLALLCCFGLFSEVLATARAGPTHFVALRLANPKLRQKIEHLQEEIWPRAARICYESSDIPEEVVKKAFMATLYPASRFHISLFVADLNDLNAQLAQLDLAKACLSEWFEEDVHQILAGRSSLDITFAGLNSFDEKVLFMQPDQDSSNHLSSLFQTLQVRLHAVNITAYAQFDDFHPHATIMKTSQLKDGTLLDRLNESLRYPPEAWMEFNRSLGTYTVEEVQLLNMLRPSEGYFQVDWEGHFGAECHAKVPRCQKNPLDGGSFSHVLVVFNCSTLFNHSNGMPGCPLFDHIFHGG